MKEGLKRKINLMIGNGRLREALELIEYQGDTQQQSDAVLLKGDLANLEKDRGMNLIPPDEYRFQRARIMKALQDIVANSLDESHLGTIIEEQTASPVLLNTTSERKSQFWIWTERATFITALILFYIAVRPILTASKEEEREIRGVVRTMDSPPLPIAHVRIYTDGEGTSTLTDMQGGFLLKVKTKEQSVILYAQKAGYVFERSQYYFNSTPADIRPQK